MTTLLTGLRLTDFRGYATLNLALTGRLTVLVGANAQGKTNLLRAVETLGLGDSGETPGELVRFGAAAAAVEGRLERDGRQERLALQVTAKGLKLAVDGKAATRPRWVGRLPVLFVGPDDRGQVTGPPSARRAMLDELLEQTDPGYLAALRAYRQALRQRNRALSRPESLPEEIEIWEEPLARAGGILLARRIAALASLAPRAAAWHRELVGPAADSGAAPKELAVAYAAGTPAPTDGGNAGWEAALREIFAASRDRERAWGSTLAGPHRDEVEIALDGRRLKDTGSSGEIWSAILAFSLASAEYLGERLGTLPVLLLDDVLTALDEVRRDRLLGILAGLPQSLLTATHAPAGLTGTVYVARAHALTRRDDAPQEQAAWAATQDFGLSVRC